MQHCANYYTLTVVIFSIGVHQSLNIGEARVRYAHAQPVALHLEVEDWERG